MIDVVQVRQLSQFLAFPEQVYAPDSRWVAPLQLHLRHIIGGLKRTDQAYWLAFRDGQPVARLGARIHGEALHFGFFESLPDQQEAVTALFARACQLGPGLPLRGPYHYHQEDVYAGVLIEGFDEDPTLMMPYNPPYYDELLRGAGLAPLMDLYSYQFRRGEARTEVMRGRAERGGIRVRTMSRWHRHRDMTTILQLVNQTHASNWGFEEYTGELAREMLLLGRFLLDPKLVWLAFDGERAVGFVIVAPDLNPLLKPARGRLGLALLLRLLFRRGTLTNYRGYGMGVLEGSRRRDAAAALVQAVSDASRHHRGDTLEVAWTLANNERMNALARALGGRRNKVHRIYELARG